jgi:hypothetical protein
MRRARFIDKFATHDKGAKYSICFLTDWIFKWNMNNASLDDFGGAI